MAQNPFITIEVVDSGDPDLHPEMDREAYQKTYDPSLIKEVEGIPVARFFVKPLVPSFAARELQGRPMAAIAHDAICAGVTSVKLRDGTTLSATMKPGQYGQPMANHKWYDQLAEHVGIEALFNVAAAVVTLTRLPASNRPTSSSSAG